MSFRFHKKGWINRGLPFTQSNVSVWEPLLPPQLPMTGLMNEFVSSPGVCLPTLKVQPRQNNYLGQFAPLGFSGPDDLSCLAFCCLAAFPISSRNLLLHLDRVVSMWKVEHCPLDSRRKGDRCSNTALPINTLCLYL